MTDRIVTPDECFNCSLHVQDMLLCARCSELYRFDATGKMVPIPQPPKPEAAVNAHTLTLEFGRFLSPDEWRLVIDVADRVPFVKHRVANAIVAELQPESAAAKFDATFDAHRNAAIDQLADAFARLAVTPLYTGGETPTPYEVGMLRTMRDAFLAGALAMRVITPDRKG